MKVDTSPAGVTLWETKSQNPWLAHDRNLGDLVLLYLPPPVLPKLPASTVPMALLIL